MNNSHISLQIPPNMWQPIRQAMLANSRDNEETIGFLFCHRVTISPERTRYVPKAWVVPTLDCYELQSASGLILNQEFHQYLLEHFLDVGEASLKENRQFDVVHIHTHAGTDFPDFSAVDDRAESEYAQFLSNRSKNPARLISGVFDESIERGQFRIWNSHGTDFQAITCHRSWLEIDNVELPDWAFEAVWRFCYRSAKHSCAVGGSNSHPDCR